MTALKLGAFDSTFPIILWKHAAVILRPHFIVCYYVHLHRWVSTLKLCLICDLTDSFHKCPLDITSKRWESALAISRLKFGCLDLQHQIIYSTYKN